MVAARWDGGHDEVTFTYRKGKNQIVWSRAMLSRLLATIQLH
jgi:hypothetical protein